MSVDSRRVLVTPRSLSNSPSATSALLSVHGLEPVYPPPGELPNVETVIRLVAGCVGWIAGVEPIGADVLRHAHDLRVISRFGAGTSNVDISAAEARGIRVLNAPGANAQGVAELALALTLNCLRSITASSQALRDGRWERHQGREIAGLSVLVLGFGAIGQRYATAMVALGAKVTAIDPIAPAHPDVVVVRDIADMIGAADVISLHCPPAPDGSAFVDAALLSRARRGVIVVNTARAELVEDEALLAALDDGRVGSYAVDAFRIEPPTPTELLRHPRVTATPHIGAFTAESAERTLLASVDNLVRALGR